MSQVGQRERLTQNRVVKFLQHSLGYRPEQVILAQAFLGDVIVDGVQLPRRPQVHQPMEGIHQR